MMLPTLSQLLKIDALGTLVLMTLTGLVMLVTEDFDLFDVVFKIFFVGVIIGFALGLGNLIINL